MGTRRCTKHPSPKTCDKERFRVKRRNRFALPRGRPVRLVSSRTDLTSPQYVHVPRGQRRQFLRCGIEAATHVLVVMLSAAQKDLQRDISSPSFLAAYGSGCLHNFDDVSHVRYGSWCAAGAIEGRKVSVRFHRPSHASLTFLALHQPCCVLLMLSRNLM